jgi:CHASE3 domain sensor protein
VIQRRKTAITFACSIPIFLGFLLFELATLYRLNAQERETVQEATRFENFNAVLLSVQDVESSARIYFASPNDHYRSDFNDAARFRPDSCRKSEGVFS